MSLNLIKLGFNFYATKNECIKAKCADPLSTYTSRRSVRNLNVRRFYSQHLHSKIFRFSINSFIYNHVCFS